VPGPPATLAGGDVRGSIRSSRRVGQGRGEALGLSRDDVDLDNGVLTIREVKFGRSRLVPLHATASEALRCYADHRDQLYPAPGAKAFFVSSIGTAISPDPVNKTFIELTTAIGLRTATSRPRIHDLRHSFAVYTLIEWHRSATDAESRVALLSKDLGHVNPQTGHGLSHSVFGGAVVSYVMGWNFYLGAGLWGFCNAVLINWTACQRQIGGDRNWDCDHRIVRDRRRDHLHGAALRRELRCRAVRQCTGRRA
jgi:hypothetical protein